MNDPIQHELVQATRAQTEATLVLAERIAELITVLATRLERMAVANEKQASRP